MSSSVKRLVDSGCLKGVPSNYVYQKNPEDDFISIDYETIPTVDFSLLTSGTPNQTSQAIRDIGNYCQDWGFFMVVNHGIPKKLIEGMIESVESFFNMPEEEKEKYGGKSCLDPIRCGTSFNVTVDKTLLWRDFLKIIVHPHFVSPLNPPGFSETVKEYCKEARGVANELLKAISKSLGLEEDYIIKEMDVEVGSQTFVANLYPPCPQPDLAMGLPPHSDYGLLTLLIQNHLTGLQIMHNGNWLPIHPLPDALLVNTGDHMEILSNGKYKSVVHRAVVNSKGTRISIGTAHGPPLDKIVSPAKALLLSNNDDDIPPPASAFRGIKFGDYLQLQQTAQLRGKSCLDHIRI